MVVHGNHPESLRSLMVAWMDRHPLAPLENEVVLVQSNGVAQWLKLSLAADRSEGGIGIAAALQTQLPSQFTWEAYRAVLGREAIPPASPGLRRSSRMTVVVNVRFHIACESRHYPVATI